MKARLQRGKAMNEADTCRTYILPKIHATDLSMSTLQKDDAHARTDYESRAQLQYGGAVRSGERAAMERAFKGEL
jgi:hypothetical protein